ncbi:MAG: polysaccharide biosynthesis/export family protein [Thermodesulfobacteriota bacterium]
MARTLLPLLCALLLSACASSDRPPALTAPAAPLPSPPIARPRPDDGGLAALAQMANSTFTDDQGVLAYRIGPGDLLEITGWEGTKPVAVETVVRPDGVISYSFLEDIPVDGLTARQVDERLTAALARYVRNARLDVTVKSCNSKSVLLFGELQILPTGRSGPGRYPLKGRTTALDLVVEAGGASKDSDLKNVELVRGGTRYTLNLYNAMLKGEESHNVVLDHGDILTIPRLPELQERIYVFGEVNSEGVYPLDGGNDLLAAIGNAGGTTPTATTGEVRVIRGYGDGTPTVLTASLDRLFRQGDISQNLPLINGDVVYVPNSAIGSLNDFILRTTPLLEFLFYPGRYRDIYSNSNALRLVK